MQENIGRYEVRREAGRGGMATVYLAFDPRFRRQVAIKVLPRQFTHDPRYLARFEQEAQMIATLEHLAIVPVYDFGEHEDAPYLVMRYMPGGTLRDRLSGDPLSLEEIAAALERLAPALDKAHEAGIVHCDLKPSNILFDDDGNPYLSDFGIARLAEASQTVTVVGTPAYMSPEQVEGDLEPDGRADIYALGVMLYELLAGRQPYMAETPTKQMMAHVLQPVPNVLEANPDLPPEAQDVIEKAMAKDRDERYATATELMTAVNGLVESTPAGQIAAATVLAVSEDRESVDLGKTGSTDGGPPKDGGSPIAPAPDIPQDYGNARGGLPGWIWWVGALLLLAIVVSSLRSILSGNGESEQVMETATAAAVAVLTEEAASQTHEAVKAQTAEAAVEMTQEVEKAQTAEAKANLTQEAATTQTVEAKADLTQEAATTETAEAKTALTREAAIVQTAEVKVARTQEAALARTAEAADVLTREAAIAQTAEAAVVLTKEAAIAQTAEAAAVLTKEAAMAQTVEAALTQTAVAITSTAESDVDRDGLTYAQERQIGTDPGDADSDDDDVPDGEEVAAGTDPLVATKGKTINFTHFPNGAAINSDVILNGDEFLEWGIQVAGSPVSSYCAEATKAAIRRNMHRTGEHSLTTASSGEVARCNTIPIAISFTRPVREVRLTFAGAEVPYEMKVYDVRDSLIGISIREPEEVGYSGETKEIGYSSEDADISRLTFGYEAAVTSIIEIYYE